MAVFETAEQLYTCISGLFEQMQSQPDTQDVLRKLGLTVRFKYTQPEASITLVAHKRELSTHYGTCDKMPDVELAMTVDVAHRLWMGEIGVMGAIAKGQVVPTGSLSQVLRLMPLLQATVKLYPQYFQDFLRGIKPPNS